MENTFEMHLSRILTRLAIGRKVLRSIGSSKLTTYEVPDVVSNDVMKSLEFPKETDK